jgi:hypothetical protein
MNNARSDQYFSLMAAIPMVQRLFGLSVSPYDVQETAFHLLPKIGGVQLGKYLLPAELNEHVVTLPCEAYQINRVTAGDTLWGIYSYYDGGRNNSYLISPAKQARGPQEFEDHGEQIGTLENGRQVVVDQLPKPVLLDDSFYWSTLSTSGQYIPYQYSDGQVRTGIRTGRVNIIYTALITDEEDMPRVRQQSLEALAYYLQYLDVQRRFFQKLVDRETLAVAETLKNSKVSQARNGDGVSEAGMSKALSALHSFSRPSTGESFFTD